MRSSSDTGTQRFIVPVIVLLAAIVGLLSVIAFALLRPKPMTPSPDKAAKQQADAFVQALKADREVEIAKAGKEQALDDGKLIALFLIAYAQDNQEKLPINEDQFFKVIGKYDSTGGRVFRRIPGTVGDRPVFAYEAHGESALPVNAYDIEIAYKRGPGGRAIIYADGHDRWKPD